MKIYLSILFLLLPMSMSAQAPGRQITRKKTSTTTSAPKNTTPTPKKTTSATKSHSSRKPRSSGHTSQCSSTTSAGCREELSPAEMSQAQKDRIIHNLINNMVNVEGGTFTMGSTSEQGHDVNYIEKPAHRVTLSSFSIGRYEVTQEEWLAVTGSNPSYFKGSKLPVENVSWDECQVFIRELNNMTGRRFRLPTEAEWEYAARGGRSRGYKYSGSNDIGQIAWYFDNSSQMTHEVGTKVPNELGFYDMSGNVWEWCQDWYDAYSPSAQVNPTGPSSGTFRVQRGGSLGYIDSCCSISYRGHCMPDVGRECQGLRLAY